MLIYPLALDNEIALVKSLYLHFVYLSYHVGFHFIPGQKFAMLEIKTLLVYMLKKFRILPLMDPKDLRFETGIILRTPNAIKVKLQKRLSTWTPILNSQQPKPDPNPNYTSNNFE